MNCISLFVKTTCVRVAFHVRGNKGFFHSQVHSVNWGSCVLCSVSAQDPGTYLTFSCGISVKHNSYSPALHRNKFLSLFFFFCPYRSNLMTSVGIAHKQEGEKVIWILLKAKVRARSLCGRPVQDKRGFHLLPLLQRLHPAWRFRQVSFSSDWSFTGGSVEVLASQLYKFCQ